MKTILGPKGYAVLKKDLTMEQQQTIRKDLTVKPMTPGAPVQTASTFSVWRENTTKIYMPRYYGEKHFGSATECTLPKGDLINLPFAGTLRDYQLPVVQKYIDYITLTDEGKGGLLDLYPAWGKTSSALNIASCLGVKTLVIVGKDFLMNQWIERIEQFLPGARIGKIQGPVIDIEDKDIVLVMLQSLVSKTKNYPPELFASFGFTILDEVHHVSSESFSRCMFSVVTRYMLGLSGTMDRKDGTTDVFKMFLGNVVHKAERPLNDMAVNVRKIKYQSHDTAYEEPVLDFRGKPQISSMISKMCQYSPRTDFILQVLKDFIQAETGTRIATQCTHHICTECKRAEIYPVNTVCCKTKLTEYRCLDCWEAYETEWEANYTVKFVHSEKTKRREEVRTYPKGKIIKCPNCTKKLKYEQMYVDDETVKPYTQLQTIVMSHNINILKYMYRHIVSFNMASVGYYIGGMKQSDLKLTEKKHVVLGSYQMTSEGLDIASLNAEFLITPKTDVEQVVGRILRAKHPITSPVIYDFVDTHETFQRQWTKRKKFYKNQGFQITETTSDIYKTNKNAASNTDNSDESANEKEPTDGILKGVCFLKNLKK